MQLPNNLKKFGIEQAIDYITKNPEKNLPKLMDWANQFANKLNLTYAEIDDIIRQGTYRKIIRAMELLREKHLLFGLSCCDTSQNSDSNIREKSLLDALRSPLFMAYHDGQPFNENMLRPCPMLENPQLLRRMVSETEARSTDPQSPESVEHLCAKCDRYAADWAPVSEALWEGSSGQARYLAKRADLDEEKARRRAGRAAGAD